MSIDRSRVVFGQTVVREFAFLKSTARIEDLQARALIFPGGLLSPVCELHVDDDRLIAELSRWRHEHRAAFPSQFTVTEAGTARWLRRALLEVPDRILFLVCNRHGHAIGHLGFADGLAGERSLEVDNVVRGELGQPGLMSAALRRLIAWGTETLGAGEIHLRVFEDNVRAVAFYRRLGFAEAESIPLHREAVGDGVSMRPATSGESVDRTFLRMTHLAPAVDESSETILTAGPSISPREVSYVTDAVRGGWNHRHSEYLDRFAEAFAEYIGVRYALPTSSCTGALHLSLLACGIGPGDEVIVPDLTWVATANAVTYTGAIPVFADVEEDSWCLDPAALRAAITPRTRAIMPVHLYGHPARMDRIGEIAREHALRVVEDAAPSIGAEVAGARTGSFGDAAAFSFQGAKLLVTGEGGMLVTDSEEIFERARYLWGLGHEGDFWIGATGWKYRMSNVQAALGLGQLERADEQIEAKRRIFGWYAEELSGLPGLQLNAEAPWARSIYWMSSVRVLPESGTDRDVVRASLRARGIDTRPVFPAISAYPMWPRRQSPGPIAHAIGRQSINLPSGVCLTRAQIARVGTAVREAIASPAAVAA